MNKPLVCPNCKKSDGLSISKPIDYELSWNSAAGEYQIGPRCSYQDPEGDSIDEHDEIECNCGWSGAAKNLVPLTTKYRVIMTLDLVGGLRIPIKDWDMKDLLDLREEEDAVVEAVAEFKPCQ